jgi:hypothetical protein
MVLGGDEREVALAEHGVAGGAPVAVDRAADADPREPRHQELRAIQVVGDGTDRKLDVDPVRIVLLDQPLRLGDVLILRPAAARDLGDLLEWQREVPAPRPCTCYRVR